MMRFLMISCKEASFLTTKREEGALTVSERLKWLIHIAICEFCRRFYRQTRHFHKQGPHIRSEEELSAESRERMEQVIRENRR